jgi:hypothetical protein
VSDFPKDYAIVPLPSLPAKQSWNGVVYARAQIRDPDFHRGNREAIRLFLGWEVVEGTLPDGRKTRGRKPILGDWIEFRDFKTANAYVQAVKRLST